MSALFHNATFSHMDNLITIYCFLFCNAFNYSPQVKPQVGMHLVVKKAKCSYFGRYCAYDTIHTFVEMEIFSLQFLLFLGKKRLV